MLINNYNIDVSKLQQNSDGHWNRIHHKNSILFNETYKQCSECKEIKLFLYFHKSSNQFLFLTSKCRDCRKKIYKKNNKKLSYIVINNYKINTKKYKKIGKYYKFTGNNKLLVFNETHKQCCDCEEIKKFKEFSYRKNGRLNLHYRCIICQQKFTEKPKLNNYNSLYQKQRSKEIVSYKKDKLPLGYETKNKWGLLQVKCYKCAKWTFVTYSSLTAILQAQKGNNTGQLNLYCSNECKKACSEYQNKSTNRELKAFNQGMSLIEYELILTNNINNNLITLVIKKAKERDNYTCQECGSKENLHGHHIKPISLCLGTNDEYLIYETSNIKTVCEECHKIEHVDELSLGNLKGQNKVSICL